MPRYINADKIISHINAEIEACENPDVYSQPVAYGTYLGLQYARSVVETAETADVVSKSEVEFLRKTIAENAQKSLEVTLEEIEKTKAEIAKEIFEEMDNIIYNLRDSPFYSSSDAVYELTELKKKYTGEKEDGKIY